MLERLRGIAANTLVALERDNEQIQNDLVFFTIESLFSGGSKMAFSQDSYGFYQAVSSYDNRKTKGYIAIS